MVFFLVFVDWYGVFVFFFELLCTIFLWQLPLAVDVS